MGKFRKILEKLSARDTPRFSFPADNLSKYQGILTELGTCIKIKEMWYGIANRQILSNFDGVLCRDTPIFSFSDNNLGKYQNILTKLSTCIDIKEICFGIANGQISSIFDSVICPQHDDYGILLFYVFIDQICIQMLDQF